MPHPYSGSPLASPNVSDHCLHHIQQSGTGGGGGGGGGGIVISVLCIAELKFLLSCTHVYSYLRQGEGDRKLYTLHKLNVHTLNAACSMSPGLPEVKGSSGLPAVCPQGCPRSRDLLGYLQYVPRAARGQGIFWATCSMSPGLPEVKGSSGLPAVCPQGCPRSRDLLGYLQYVPRAARGQGVFWATCSMSPGLPEVKGSSGLPAVCPQGCPRTRSTHLREKSGLLESVQRTASTSSCGGVYLQTSGYVSRTQYSKLTTYSVLADKDRHTK